MPRVPLNRVCQLATATGQVQSWLLLVVEFSEVWLWDCFVANSARARGQMENG